LHRASNAGSLDIVSALVEGKADLQVVDKVTARGSCCSYLRALSLTGLLNTQNGMTALDWAVSQEHDEIAALLRRAAEAADDAEVTEVSQPAPTTTAPAC
jgi:ankyrin repeat protein